MHEALYLYGITKPILAMRLDPGIRFFIKDYFSTTSACVYLFGSRVCDTAKGGDIDIMILSEKKIEHSQLRVFRREFFKKFGFRKIDIVNYTFGEESTFKSIISANAIKL